MSSSLQCYVVRLQRGEELRKTLLRFVEVHNLKGAFIVSCIGSATSAKLRMASYSPSNSEPNYMLDLMTPSEIVSVTGTLSGGGHLHASLSDHMGKVIGGHLLELMVDTTAEVVVGNCPSLVFKRELDGSTGFHELVVENKN